MPSNQYPLIAREGWSLLAILIVLIILAKFILGISVSIILSLLLVVFIFLLRDPVRSVPALPLAIVSPIYGIVTDIEDVEDPRLSRSAKRIRMKVSFNDIYSLRSPIEGKVIEQWSLRPGKTTRRHQFDYWIQTDEGDDILIKVSFRRYIRSFLIYLQSGERIGQGQRCGFLYFGGMVDVYVPINSRIEIQAGDKVDSGSSVLAHFVHSHAVSTLTD
jgi:phosphatidylserine decarboxylase